MTAAPPPFRWGAIVLPALLPTLLFSIGEGAIIPVIPVVADNLGASLALAGLVAALLTVGELVGTMPGGALVARIGERPAMIGAAALSVVGLIACVVAPTPLVLGVGILLVGLATAVFALARHAFMTSFVPPESRARALSTLAGVFRLGFFIGPFLTAGAIALTGSPTVAFVIHGVACAVTVLILLFLPDPAVTFGAVHTVRVEGRQLRDGEALVAGESHGLLATLRRYRPVLVRLGVGAALVGGLRASRNVIIPLWAVSIGVGDTTAALVIGVAAGLDFALFYAGGWIMDRFGRLWTAVPSMIGLAVGHLLLALTHDAEGRFAWFVTAAMVLALSNGIGSGILMTLGADLADKTNPAPFLGAWRFTGSLGGAAAPIAIAGLTAALSLAFAAGVMGVLGLVGAGVLARYVPRFLPRRPA